MKRNYFLVAVLATVAALMMPVDFVLADNSPLCFTARNGSVDVKFDIKNVTHSIQYSTDGSSWSTYASGTDVTIAANQSVYFRAETNQDSAVAFGSGYSEWSNFNFSSSNGGMVEGSGNIMSLYGPDCPDLPLKRYAFFRMFSGCTSLTQAPSLPATTLAEVCYTCMFAACTSLTQAPSLPATTLAFGCYSSMFSGCTSLTKAPSLPATTLAVECYEGMFIGCISLTQIPALPATTLAECCYDFMFYNCTWLVVNTEAPGKQWMIPATTNATGALDNMFTGTGGTMNGSPQPNKTYYVASDPTAAVENVVENREYVVFAEGNGIVVKGASNVSISDASGRIVYDGKMNSEMERFEMPVAGIYFVRCDNKKSYTIMVK